MFQNHKVIMEIFYWFDPSLRNFHIDMDKVIETEIDKESFFTPFFIFVSSLSYIFQDYGVNCSHVTLERIWSHIDVFAYGHFLGWMFKVCSNFWRQFFYVCI